MEEKSNNNSNKLENDKEVFESGASVLAGAIAGAFGYFAGDPIGAAFISAGGALVGEALKSIGKEFIKRHLSPGEDRRVGTVISVAIADINMRIRSGDTIREDGYFDKKQNKRPDAEEVVESVLLKSQREPEEMKIPYMGYMLSSITFDSSISVSLAHQLIKTSEQLTYRQLCLLKLAVIKEIFSLRRNDYRAQGSFSKDLYQILYEILDLYHRGFINFESEVAFGPTDVNPGTMTVQGLGIDIYNTMKLFMIPGEDLIPLVSQLK